LTHSLEVAQISRSVARQLNLDEDLTEAITLAHDLGHTPFGHAGQDALNACMKPYGGFEHNLQSLRVVDHLEQRYGGFDGLNLTYETREGILKHCSRKNALLLGDVAERFIQRRRPSLEAQLVNLSDELAYNNHDVDDGLRSGLVTLEQLCTVPIFKHHHDLALKEFPKLNGRRLVHETVRRMISTLVLDLTTQSAANIKKHAPHCIDEVRRAPALVSFSPRIEKEQLALKQFLRDNLYQHYRVARTSSKARRIVTELFNALLAEPKLLPPDFQTRARSDKPRAIADYIAGMTDRYAMLEHRRLFAVEPV
jgi:dGTPase